MAYTTIDDPSAHFHTRLYSGNGSTQSITNNANAGNFKPDWLWIKERTSTSQHFLFDSTRGVGKYLHSDSNSSEGNDVHNTSFDTNGFGIGQQNGTNENSQTYVAWQWKANGGTTTSGGSDDTVSTSAHQANTTAGFSVVTYSGTGTTGHTVAHGLGVAPEVIILKARNKSQNWRVFHHKTASDGTKRLILDQTNAQEDAAFLNDTAPSSTVFTLGASDDAWNASDGTYVAYCFAPIQGYSKFGSYKANGNVDGPFVYTGFKPAWVMFKQTNSSDTAHWFIYDSTRSPTNVIGDVGLAPNLSNAEGLGSTWNPNTSNSVVDFVSNGFKIRTTATSGFNINGNTMIYMAFAEHPFVSSKGVPVTAR